MTIVAPIPDPALVVLVGPSGSGKSVWAAEHYRSQEVVSSRRRRAVVGSGEHDLDASADAFALLDHIVAARLRRGLTAGVDTLGLDPAPPPGSAGPEASHSPGARAAASEQRQRPVRMGLVLQLSRFPWDDDPHGPAHWLAGVARAVAEAGLQGIALMDHLIQIPQVGRAWEPIPEPWVTLGLLAGLAPGLRLGTLVTPVTFRAPGILAKTVATLDVLNAGRAFCGIGAGWWDREHAAFGLPFPAASARLDQLEVTIETLRALWQPGTKAYQGTKVWL